MNSNLLKALIDNLQEFREYDVVVSEIYGYVEPFYDLRMFINVIKTLNFFIQTTYYITGTNDYVNMLAKEFNPSSLEKIQKAIDIFFQEVENKKIDYFQLNSSKKEVFYRLFFIFIIFFKFIDSFMEFLNDLMGFYKKFFNTPYSANVLSSISAMIGILNIILTFIFYSFLYLLIYLLF